MKKIILRVSSFFIALIIGFISIPFFNVRAISSIPSWLSSENIQYFLATQLGLVSSSNDSLQSFFENPNFQTFSDAVNNAVVFVPGMGVFRLGIPDAQLEGFSKDDCDIVVNDDDTVTFKDDFVHSTVGSFGTNIDSPLDGVEVKTNFSDFNPQFSILKRPYSVEQTFNNFKNSFLSFDNRLTIIACGSSSNYMTMYYSFFSPNNNVDFYGFYYNTAYQRLEAYCHDNSSWVVIPYVPQIFAYTVNNTGTYLDGANLLSSNNSYFYSNSDFSDYDSSAFTVYKRVGNYTTNVGTSYWSNIPVVIGSSTQAIQNFYYWKNSAPSGVYFNVSNMQENYNTSYVDNNWSSTYNNYLTDVSNYYSTTENITNENLTQYIDQSTTITNITNNYITNNNGGESGGGSSDNDIITNSWLQRIYNLLLDFYFAFIGTPTDSGSGSGSNKFYTDNSIKNDVINYPLSEWFPNLPEEYFIPESSEFTWPLFSSKVARVLETAMPFCYIEKLKYVATFVATPPQQPHYEIPFVIDSFGIEETVNISFEDSAWSVLHSVWIVLFMIIFIIALFYFTYRFILLVSTIIGFVSDVIR